MLPSLFYGLQSDDTDTFYHLAAGRFMAEHGGVLDREVASFTIPGRPWTNYSWLFQRLLYAAHGQAGLAGVVAVRSAFQLALANLLFLLLLRRSRGQVWSALALGLLAVGLVSGRGLQVRPHLASYVALVGLLLVIECWQGRPRRSAAAGFLICAAWANLHGIGFPVGLAAVAVAAGAALVPHLRGQAAAALAKPEPRRLLLLLAACSAGFLANPFGLRLLLAPLVATDAEAMSQIGEMGRLPLASFAHLGLDLEWRSSGLVNVLVVGGLALLPVWWAASAWGAIGSFALGLFLLGFRGGRMVPELAILALPALAEGLALRLPVAPGLRRVLQALTAYLVTAALVTTWRDARSGLFELVSERLPHGPVALLEREGLGGNLLADASNAGFVSWRLPQVRIFMDMRMPEPFSSHELWEYRTAVEGGRVDAVRARHALDGVLVRLSSPLAARLLARPEEGLALSYADATWALFLPDPLLERRPELRLSTLPELQEIADGGAPAVDRDLLARDVDRLIGLWPGNHLAQRAWLWLRTTGGQPEQAAEAAHRLGERYPRLPVYPYCEGLAWNAAGQLAPAAQAFDRARRIDPAFEPAYPLQARALAALGHAGPALEALEAFYQLRRYKLDAADYLLLGSLRQQAGDLAGAAEALERALWLLPAGDPRQEGAGQDLVALSVKLGRPRRAMPDRRD
jgi:tetratricopeptide (TPR) repeat protein